MSSETAQKIRSLKDYEDLLALLAGEGVPHLVIGGCAVGAYGRLMGETVLSADLDLYADERSAHAIIGCATRDGATVFRRPQPRSLQVTMFHWRELEVNILSSSPGLQSPLKEMQDARAFQSERSPGERSSRDGIEPVDRAASTGSAGD